jgi:electron transport complex protein RnfC
MTVPTYDLGTLHGGLRLPAHKRESTAQAILEVPIPAQLVLPIEQHVGEPAQPIVGVGDRVLKRQVVAEPDGGMGVPVHASSSGMIVAIESCPVSRRHGDTAPCIVIDCDGEDKALPESSRSDYRELPPSELLLQIFDGGIAGLGGAVFPTAQKLMQARTAEVEYLILNGVECEPYISCDDMLMRAHAEGVVGGAQILLHALQINTCLIVIESDKPDALRRLGEALAEANDERIVLKQVPTIYPSGGEDQLVQLVTNREVPTGGLPTDVGCIVQNVGTAAAVHDWIVGSEPLISRITTVSGDGVEMPVNVRARLGTPIADVIKAAGGYRGEPKHLLVGGPMTGRSVTTDAVPLVKATNCILVLAEAPSIGPERPCIRCGDCAAVCPVRLQPQQLLWHANADDERKMREYGLTDCIECGCCDLVCPSRIRLTSGFRKAKGRIREFADQKARAERARRRFEARNERLQRERREREDELARQKAAARSAGPTAIAEILARKRGKNAGDSE